MSADVSCGELLRIDGNGQRSVNQVVRKPSRITGAFRNLDDKRTAADSGCSAKCDCLGLRRS